MDNQINILKKQVRAMKLILAIFLIPLVALTIYGFDETRKSKIIRVRGIIVEDENGKERILIGAPLPFAKNRARTDTNKIKEKWPAKRMGRKYMGFYKGYDHNCNGIVILDEYGWDKIAIGDPVPDPIIGKRIGPETGIIMNDDEGLERAGFGAINVDGQLRSVLGLDHKDGEGAVLFVQPDGSAGLSVHSKDNSVFVGYAGKDNWRSPDKKTFTGITIKDSTKKTKIIKVE